MKYLLTLVMLVSTNYAFSLEGLKVGDKAPAISIETLNGETINFSKLDKTALVFYRGAWCPYCIKQLDSIQKEVLPKIGDRSTIIAISVDKKSVAKKMKASRDYGFQVISDPKAKTLKAFNIVNKLDDELVKKYKSAYKIDVEADSGETHHMVAHPAVFIIRDGMITYADIHTDYKKRTKNSEILERLTLKSTSQQ